jgi:hypothetical protein
MRSVCACVKSRIAGDNATSHEGVGEGDDQAAQHQKEAQHQTRSAQPNSVEDEIGGAVTAALVELPTASTSLPALLQAPPRYLPTSR